MFNKNNEQKWFEFLSKRFGPGPSSVELKGPSIHRGLFTQAFTFSLSGFEWVND